MAHLENRSSSQDWKEQAGHSRSNNEGQQTTENPATGSDNLRFNFNVHRPLSHNKSVPSFKDERIYQLQVIDEGRRSRSHSEPLTREAAIIAQQLRKASDLFNTNYETLIPERRREFVRRRWDRSRRVTVGGTGGESLRQEINQALRANGGMFGYNPTPPEGTPV